MAVTRGDNLSFPWGAPLFLAHIRMESQLTLLGAGISRTPQPHCVSLTLHVSEAAASGSYQFISNMGDSSENVQWRTGSFSVQNSSPDNQLQSLKFHHQGLHSIHLGHACWAHIFAFKTYKKANTSSSCHSSTVHVNLLFGMFLLLNSLL